ncbi:hypothetical protein C0993_011054 [Termitomyces sp. T159_Od127]|nr:hypothetical protein C0993_011054 [Termitomyces sp. T159_Od127]
MDSDEDASRTLLRCPRNHQLVVQGCTLNVPSKNPSTLVRDLLISLGKDPRYDGEPGAEPRVDLLENISAAIAEAKPDWEVWWSASRKGRSDKRLSCRLLGLYPGATDRANVPSEHLPILKNFLEEKGYKVAAIFTSFGGPQVAFLLPKDADPFMALGSIQVPSKVSCYPARIEPLKEIPVERPFELVVTGARDYDELGPLVEKWARKTAPSTFIGMRTTDTNPDLIIFSMSTWAATLLRAPIHFENAFPKMFRHLTSSGTITIPP